MSRRLGVRGAVVDGTWVPGDVEVDGDRISRVGASPAGPSGLAVAGMVDLQVNGFGGADLRTTDPEAARIAARSLLGCGVTAWLPTLPTGSEDSTLAALRTLARAVTEGPADGARALGVHLEGPFLNPVRKGAHPLEHLQPPSLEAFERQLAAGPVRLVTLAPEVPGAHPVLRRAVEAGVTVSIGHTDATAEEARTAFALGATAHTHVGNAHRPIASRDPGPAVAALLTPTVTPCVIADLEHVSADVLQLFLATAADRYAVVSDAGPSAAPGTTGAFRLPDGSLCGSSAGLDVALRNLVAIGRPLEEAVAAVTSRPAALIGAHDHGRLVEGGRADVVVFDEELHLRWVLLGGVAFVPGADEVTR